MDMWNKRFWERFCVGFWGHRSSSCCMSLLKTQHRSHHYFFFLFGNGVTPSDETSNRSFFRSRIPNRHISVSTGEWGRRGWGVTQFLLFVSLLSLTTTVREVDVDLISLWHAAGLSLSHHLIKNRCFLKLKLFSRWAEDTPRCSTRKAEVECW